MWVRNNLKQNKAERTLSATNRTFSLIIKAENLQNYFEDFPPSTKRLSSWFCDLWYVILWYRFSQITKSHITNHKITITKSQITITKLVIMILWDLWFCDFVFTRIPNLFSCICPLFILWFRSQNLWLWLCDFVIRDLWFYDILDHKITNHESQKIVIINLWFCDCFFLCKKIHINFQIFFRKFQNFLWKVIFSVCCR